MKKFNLWTIQHIGSSYKTSEYQRIILQSNFSVYDILKLLEDRVWCNFDCEKPAISDIKESYLSLYKKADYWLKYNPFWINFNGHKITIKNIDYNELDYLYNHEWDIEFDASDIKTIKELKKVQIPYFNFIPNKEVV